MTFHVSRWLLILISVYVVPRLTIIPDTNPVQKQAGAQIPLLCKVDRVPEGTRPGIIWIKHDGLDRYAIFTYEFRCLKEL